MSEKKDGKAADLPMASPTVKIDAEPYKGFATDVENLLRVLYAGFFEIDPCGLKYNGVMRVLEGMISYLKLGRECNCP